MRSFIRNRLRFTAVIIAALFWLVHLGAGAAGAVDFGVPADKGEHLGAGYMISDVSKAFKANAVQSFFLVLAAGVVKEAIDVQHGGPFDLKDVSATLGGWGCSYLAHIAW